MKKNSLVFLLCFVTTAAIFAQNKNAAKQKLSEGKYEEAYKLFDQVLKSEPNNKEALFYKGNAAEMGGKLNEARLTYTRLIEVDSKNPTAYAKRGQIHHRLKDYASAVGDYTNALQYDNADQAAIHFQRAEAYFELRRYDKAAADYDLAKSGFAQNGYLLYKHGVCLSRLNQPKDAIKLFTQAIALSPDDVDAYLQRGIAYSKIEDFKNATKDLEKAIDLSPAYPEAYVQLGNLYVRQENCANACKYFRQAAAMYQGIADKELANCKCGK